MTPQGAASTGGPARRARTVTVLCARFRPERYGGVEERLWRVTNEMARRGWRVEVLTENRLGAPPVEEIVPGITVRRFPPFAPGVLWRWFHLDYLLWWYRVLRAHRPSGIVWASDPVMAAAAIALGHRRTLVLNPACCVAGMGFIGSRHAQATSLQVARSLVWIDRCAYRWALVVVLSSRSLERQFARFYGPRTGVQVCRYASNEPRPARTRAEARHALGLEPEAFIVGFTGRLDPCKGIEFLLAAIRLARLGPNDRLLMVGEGSDRARLEQLAQEEGIADRVVWTGHVRQPDDVYQAMDVLVLPSIYEAFGLVLLEAMGAGIPVIGRAMSETVFTASDEVIEHGRTGFITQTDEPSELAEHLTWLKTHPAERLTMGQAAREAAMRRTWTDVVDDYEAALAAFA